MSAEISKSIFLSADGELVVQPVTEHYSIEGSQCLVRVEYSAINPCDLNFYHIGLKSTVTGFELSGTVQQAGPNSAFQMGDAVCGIAPVMLPMPSSYGTHQDLVVARSELLYKFPSNLSLKDASAICMAAHTSADALFNVIGLGFPAADVTGIDPTGRGILIWGGASSVGCMAIQIAKAAGFQHIFTTASHKNQSALRQLGATHCFDYHSSSVVNDIQTTQKDLGIKLTMAFDTVGKGALGHGVIDGLSTPALARSALDSSGLSKDIYLVCTLPVPADSAFKLCTSYRPNGDRNAMGAPQDPEAPIRIRKIMEHLLASTDGGLRLPVVTAVTGAEAGIEAIRRVAAGEVSMEKLVLKHPLE